MTDEVLRHVWPDLRRAFIELEADASGWYLLPVGLRGPKRINRIIVHQDRVERISDGSNSQIQPIPKKHFIDFARMAIEAEDGRFCIKGSRIVETGRCGSFVSTSLALLPYFEYRLGQYLIFSRNQFDKRSDSCSIQ